MNKKPVSWDRLVRAPFKTCLGSPARDPGPDRGLSEKRRLSAGPGERSRGRVLILLSFEEKVPGCGREVATDAGRIQGPGQQALVIEAPGW